MIPTYKPGPIAELPPEPSPFVVPRMSQAVDVTPPAVWRVAEADLPALEWVPARLAETYPHLVPEGILSWLRAAIHDRHSLLIRTARLVGLFAAETTVLDPQHPVVYERWVRSHEKANDEGGLLYRYARDWAASIRASRFEYNRDSDCGMVHVNPFLSDVKKNFTVQKASVYSIAMLE